MQDIPLCEEGNYRLEWRALRKKIFFRRERFLGCQGVRWRAAERPDGVLQAFPGLPLPARA